MTIFLTGGGTAGSVTPLLAVAEHISNHQLHFIGTKMGVERQLMPATMSYHAIAAGKWRRYWSWRNLADVGHIVVAFMQALWLVARYQPAVVVSIGSFVSVPVVWAAWWCSVPVVIHQQDVQVGLATRLMKPCATSITKAFAETNLAALCIGNPVRSLVPTTHDFKLDPAYPTVLIFGGGTGSQGINQAVTADLCEFANIIHGTGEGRSQPHWKHPRYHPVTFLKDTMAEALQVADVVVCRAGLGTLSELAALGKAAIIIPMPQSHQEANAALFKQHQACIVLPQTDLTPTHLAHTIQALLSDTAQRHRLQQAMQTLNPATTAQVLAKTITQVAQHT